MVKCEQFYYLCLVLKVIDFFEGLADNRLSEKIFCKLCQLTEQHIHSVLSETMKP